MISVSMCSRVGTFVWRTYVYIIQDLIQCPVKCTLMSRLTSNRTDCSLCVRYIICRLAGKCSNSFVFGVRSQIYEEDPRPASCNGVVSHGAQIGGMRKNKRKTKASTIFVCRAAFYVCSSLCSDHSRCR